MKYIVCNLKANKNNQEMSEYEKEISKINIEKELDIIICPSTPFLYLFSSSKYLLGAQDISMYEQGSYTGETTADQLSSLNVKYALIGHSERRKIIKEDEHTIIQKIKKAYHSHIKPIYFIGETENERNNNKTNEVLTSQLVNIISEVPDYKREKMIIVYEPIWAIGTGKLPTNNDIKSRILMIKKIIMDKYSLNLPVLYGGSINENNIESLLTINELDGFVLGESSKESNNLINIIEIIEKNL